MICKIEQESAELKKRIEILEDTIRKLREQIRSILTNQSGKS